MTVDRSDVSGLDPFDLMDAESERLSDFFGSLSDDEWLRDTRCAGWRRRELVSHLAGADTYHTACLDDAIEALFAEGARNGATDLNSMNDWMIRVRAERSADDVLAEWRDLNASVRRRMRERGADATMASSVGPYPVDLMGFHLASEYATHYDDMEGPLSEADVDARTAWRDAVSRFALKEAGKPVAVEPEGDGYRVDAGDEAFTLSRRDFVEAVTARLPADHPIPASLREALRALA